MVFDCFPFFNELDLLEIRLNVLKDVVDFFVLVEAGETHTGKPKPFHFEENRARFAAFADRIVHIKIDHFPETCRTSWARENYQRNRIDLGLRGRAKDDDLILISDLDEIPDPACVTKDVPPRGVTVFEQRYYAFFVNYDNVRRPSWNGTRRVTYRDFKSVFDGVRTLRNEILVEEVNVGTTASKIRCRKLPRSRGGEKRLKNAGWHFTCLGGVEMVAQKIVSFAHEEYNPGVVDLKKVEEIIRRGKGVFWKMNCFAVPLDERFPKYILENRERYAHLIFDATPEYLRRVRWTRFLRTLQGAWIIFAEAMCPAAFHNFLHLIKLRLSGRL